MARQGGPRQQRVGGGRWTRSSFRVLAATARQLTTTAPLSAMIFAVRQAARRAPAQARAFHSSPVPRAAADVYIGKAKAAGASVAAKVEPAVYYTKVAGEVAKQVFQGQALAPPTSFAQIKAAYQTWYANASSINWWNTIAANGQWKTVALYGLEAYGFFKIGEIVRCFLPYTWCTPANIPLLDWPEAPHWLQG